MSKEKTDFVLSEDMKKKLGYVCLHTASIYPTYRDFKLTEFRSELVNDNTSGSDFHVMTFTSPDVNGTYMQIQVLSIKVESLTIWSLFCLTLKKISV